MLRAFVGLAVGGVALASTVFLLDSPWAAPGIDCSGGRRLCPKLEIESPAEKLRQAQAPHPFFSRNGVVPKGAARKAVEGKAALESRKADVSGANGQWREYGRGGLLSSGLAQTLGVTNVPDTNLHLFAGRVDNFSYDEANQRLRS